MLPQLAQKVVLLAAAWPHERADVVPARTVQGHHRPIPTETDDMAVIAQLGEIGQLHGTVADLQRVIHVERVHDHGGCLQLFWLVSRHRLQEDEARLLHFPCSEEIPMPEYIPSPRDWQLVGMRTDSA